MYTSATITTKVDFNHYCFKFTLTIHTYYFLTTLKCFHNILDIHINKSNWLVLPKKVNLKAKTPFQEFLIVRFQNT